MISWIVYDDSDIVLLMPLQLYFHHGTKNTLAVNHLDQILILILTLVMQCVYEIGRGNT